MLFVRGVLIIDGPELLTRKMRQFAGESAAEGIRFWHGRFLPKHFRGGASERYGYRKRSKGYLVRKRRRFPGTPDLVLTGLTRRTVTRFIRVVSRGSRAVGTMAAPSYIMSRRRKSGAINLAGEILITPDVEVQEIGAFVRERLLGRLGGAHERKEIRLAS